MESVFDVVAGLPVHPLVIHSVVVLVPLAAVGLVVAVFNSAFRKRFAVALIILLGITVPLAFIAKESGEALAERIGITERHEELGENVPLWVGVFFVVAVVWWLVTRRSASVLVRRILGGVLVLTAGQVLVVIFLVGHSGAEATWGETTPAAEQPVETESAAPEAPAVDDAVFTADEVAMHSTAEDCWTIVDGSVYDVTPFVSRHPGGLAAISTLCGGDGTADFGGKHGSDSAPNSQLESLKIGTLGTP
jgi:hypothetical protein